MQAKSLVKGICIGIVAGSVLTAAAVPLDKKRLSRSKTGRALRAAGHVLEGISDSFCS
jgi:hypothetical protein